MAGPVDQRDDMYQQLLSISIRASDETSFEVAFHALSAAMHRAKDLGNAQFLRELLQKAEQQKKLLDEQRNQRDDITVLIALVQRMDGTLRGLVGEMRALHAQIARIRQQREQS